LILSEAHAVIRAEHLLFSDSSSCSVRRRATQPEI
jgi:hypothetical protein